MLLYLFSRFENEITLAKNNIFPFWEKFLVADVLHHKKVKIDLRPPSPRKHDFEIVVGPKGPSSGPTFWPGLETPDH